MLDRRSRVFSAVSAAASAVVLLTPLLCALEGAVWAESHLHDGPHAAAPSHHDEKTIPVESHHGDQETDPSHRHQDHDESTCCASLKCVLPERASAISSDLIRHRAAPSHSLVAILGESFTQPRTQGWLMGDQGPPLYSQADTAPCGPRAPPHSSPA